MEIENRLRKLETRLSSIEKFIAENFVPKSKTAQTETVTVAPVSAPAPVAAPAQTSVLSPLKKDDNSIRVPNYAPADPNAKASLHFVDTQAFNKVKAGQSSNYLLMPIAVLGFMLVSFFILRFGVDTGWLTPIKQLFFTVLLSVLFIAAGFFYKELNNEYIRYLPGVGVLLLFLAGFGSTNFYHFFPKNAAFLFIGTVAVCCMLMYQEFRHTIYMIVGAVGAYVIPLYIAGEDNLTLTNSYFLLMSLIFSGLACWLNLRPVYLLCAYLSLPISAIADYHDNDLLHKSLFMLAHFLIFTGGMFVHVYRSKQPLTKVELLGFAPVVLLFFVIQYYTLSQQHPVAAPVFIFLTCVYIGVLFFLGRKPEVAKVEEEEIQIVQV